MINEHMMDLGSRRSTIRELFEYGNSRAAIVGRENVFDFSIGNPNVPAPEAVRQAIYAEAAGDRLHCTAIPRHRVPQTCRRTGGQPQQAFRHGLHRRQPVPDCRRGSRALLLRSRRLSARVTRLCLHRIFPEYKMFIESGAGAKCVIVPPSIADFQIDFGALEQRLNEHTKAVVVNSPNNPSGAVYSEQTIKRLADILRDKEKEYGHPIYLISDEPYREIVYDGVQVPFVPHFYDDTIICYSYSKSLSLPGERIGYVLVPPAAADSKALYAAVCGAGRALGYVCAPSMFQRVAARCADQTSDIAVYQTNRDLLFNGLTSMGYHCVKPDGAFYLFPQTLEADDRAFSERAKKYDLLVVPGADFCAPGHMRISYCVKTETIERALPLFERLAKEYRGFIM